jgi:hypothetical protein
VAINKNRCAVLPVSGTPGEKGYRRVRSRGALSRRSYFSALYEERRSNVCWSPDETLTFFERADEILDERVEVVNTHVGLGDFCSCGRICKAHHWLQICDRPISI